MRPMLRPMGTARTLLASLALAAFAAGAANAASSIPISEPGTVIDQPGCYYLTRDLNGAGHPFGLVIAASNVILDMKGKTISGIGVDGILVTPDVADVLIAGGTITGFAAGIHLAAPERVKIRNMRILRNLVGIVGGKSGHTITCNVVADNGFDGIYLVGDHHTVANNRLLRNGNEELLDEFLGYTAPDKGCEGSTAGLRIEGSYATLACNFSADNKGFGISVEGDNHVIRTSTTCFNCRSGLRFRGDHSVLARNKCSENDENGILVSGISDDNRVEDNVALKNKQYDIFDGNLPEQCTNHYDDNLFETSNDPTGICIQ